MSEARIHRNLMRSVMTAPLDAATGVGLAIILIGVLTREGGLELVGRWTMLQATLSIVFAFDLGMTYGINRRVAADGPVAGLALIARAAVWPLGCLVLFGGAAALGPGWLTASAVALTAGATQLLAQWLSAVQTGAHRHVYTQAASIFLNIAQFGLVVSVAVFGGVPSATDLALALLAARALQLVFVCAALWTAPLGLPAWLDAPVRAAWREVWDSARQFTLVTVTLKCATPLLRLGVGYLGGEAALGVFAIAVRVPEAINGVFASGLQTLLAGFTAARRGAEQARLLHQGLTVVTALSLPLFLVTLAFAPSLLTLWLGQADPVLTFLTRLTCLAGIVSALATPFYWSLQATGQSNFVAALFAAQTVFILAVGALAAKLGQNVAGGFVVGLVAYSTAANLAFAIRAIRTVFGAGAVTSWLRGRRMWATAGGNVAAAFLCALGTGQGALGIGDLVVRLGVFGMLSAAMAWVAFR